MLLPDELLIKIALFANASLEQRKAMGLVSKNVRWTLTPSPEFAQVLLKRIIKPRLERISFDKRFYYFAPAIFYDFDERTLTLCFELADMNAKVVFCDVLMDLQTMSFRSAFSGRTRLTCFDKEHKAIFSGEFAGDTAIQLFWGRENDDERAATFYKQVVYKALRLYFMLLPSLSLQLRLSLRDVLVCTPCTEEVNYAYWLGVKQ